METQVFDFNGIESASGSSSILKPGQYEVTSLESVLKLPTQEGKNPYLTITFNAKGGSINRNFYITSKALNILQYINEMITGKKIARAFKSTEEVSAWFDSIFKGYNAGKTSKVAVIVGRELASDDQIYNRVIDFGFLLPVEGEFESKEYTEEEIVADRRLNKRNTYQAAQAPGSETILPQIPVYKPEMVAVGDNEDLPF